MPEWTLTLIFHASTLEEADSIVEDAMNITGALITKVEQGNKLRRELEDDPS